MQTTTLRGIVHRIIFAACVAAAATMPIYAQEKYPSRPVTIVVPYPPGGSNDLFARAIAKGLGEQLGGTFVVDNRPGASGNIGTTQVTKASPDGYTLVVVSSSMTTNAAVQTKMPFDPVKQLAPVAMLAKGPFIVAVNTNVPARTPAELVALMKSEGNKLNYATSGNGSSNQFATEMLKAATNTSMVHVPYRGMAPAVTGLLGGETQILIASGPSLLPQVRGGKVRAVAVTSLQPSPIAPDLPTMASVAPGYEFELWWGLLAPAGTPPAIVNQLNSAVNSLLATAEMKAAFMREGAVASPLSAEQFGGVIAQDIARWQRIAKQQNISAE